MIVYNPGIHGFQAMSQETESAMQSLWGSHEQVPTIQFDIQLSNAGHTIILTRPQIVFVDTITGEGEVSSLADAERRIDTSVLSLALLRVHQDESVLEFASDFQRETTALDIGDAGLTLQVMPGCLMIQNADPEYYVAERIKEGTHRKHADLWSLGIFAAGFTETPHEQMAAFAAVTRTKPAWQHYVKLANTTDQDLVRLGDPVLHPGKENYE